MSRKPSRIPDVLYIIVNIIGAWFWIIAVLYAFFLGGMSGPPDFERGTPMVYVYIIAIGIPGAMLGITAGSIGHVTGKTVKALPVSSAILMAVGTVPLFLMGMIAPGLILLPPGILFALLYLFATRKRGND